MLTETVNLATLPFNHLEHCRVHETWRNRLYLAGGWRRPGEGCPRGTPPRKGMYACSLCFSFDENWTTNVISLVKPMAEKKSVCATEHRLTYAPMLVNLTYIIHL